MADAAARGGGGGGAARRLGAARRRPAAVGVVGRVEGGVLIDLELEGAVARLDRVEGDVDAEDRRGAGRARVERVPLLRVVLERAVDGLAVEQRDRLERLGGEGVGEDGEGARREAGLLGGDDLGRGEHGAADGERDRLGDADAVGRQAGRQREHDAIRGEEADPCHHCRAVGGDHRVPPGALALVGDEAIDERRLGGRRHLGRRALEAEGVVLELDVEREAGARVDLDLQIGGVDDLDHLERALAQCDAGDNLRLADGEARARRVDERAGEVGGARCGADDKRRGGDNGLVGEHRLPRRGDANRLGVADVVPLRPGDRDHDDLRRDALDDRALEDVAPRDELGDDVRVPPVGLGGPAGGVGPARERGEQRAPLLVRGGGAQRGDPRVSLELEDERRPPFGLLRRLEDDLAVVGGERAADEREDALRRVDADLRRRDELLVGEDRLGGDVDVDVVGGEDVVVGEGGDDDAQHRVRVAEHELVAGGAGEHRLDDLHPPPLDAVAELVVLLARVGVERVGGDPVAEGGVHGAAGLAADVLDPRVVEEREDEEQVLARRPLAHQPLVDVVQQRAVDEDAAGDGEDDNRRHRQRMVRQHRLARRLQPQRLGRPAGRRTRGEAR